jgi:hypothetical protein
MRELTARGSWGVWVAWGIVRSGVVVGCGGVRGAGCEGREDFVKRRSKSEMALVLAVRRRWGFGETAALGLRGVDGKLIVERPVSRAEGRMRVLLSLLRMSQRRTSLW